MDGKDAVIKMFRAFGNTDVNRMKVYIECLAGGFPASAVVKACHKATLECKYLPTIAELVQAIKSLVGEADASRRTKTWAEAWNEIEKAMYRDGCSGRTPAFSTEEIKLTVDYIGGIDVLATCPANNFNTIRAQTKVIYDNVCKRKAEKQVNDFVLSGGGLQLEATQNLQISAVNK